MFFHIWFNLRVPLGPYVQTAEAITIVLCELHHCISQFRVRELRKQQLQLLVLFLTSIWGLDLSISHTWNLTKHSKKKMNEQRPLNHSKTILKQVPGAPWVTLGPEL